jgi:hypothetical protein
MTEGIALSVEPEDGQLVRRDDTEDIDLEFGGAILKLKICPLGVCIHGPTLVAFCVSKQ